MIKRIGVLTSGGDAPGMNAAVRAVVRTAINNGIEVFGIYEGYKGMYENNIVALDRRSVSEKIDRGGTFLYTARLKEFADVKIREVAIENLKKNGIQAVVVIGGDGSYMGALRLTEMGINCIAIPGTIDNDIASSDYTIGFDTALNTIVENIGRLRDTSMSHKRCSIIEVMGRNCGDLAIHSGIATGAEYVLTSEFEFDIDEIIKDLKLNFRNKRHLILTVTENLLDVNELAKKISEQTGIEARATVLGHIQRGGAPSANDRILASRMGIKAVELLLEGIGGQCVCLIKNEIIAKPIEQALAEKTTPLTELYNNIKNLR